MKKMIYSAIVVAILASISCNSKKAVSQDSPVAPITAAQAKIDSLPFANVKLDSKWDLSCGMPLSAGLEDTAHYKGKLYGFCSKECKEEFLKDPATAVQSKKDG